MAVLKFFDGTEWKPFYANEIKNLNDRIYALETLEIETTTSSSINEVPQSQLKYQSTSAEDGVGPIKTTVADKAYDVSSTKKVTDLVKDLVKYAHRHKVENSLDPMTHQCDCQCQCQCNCQCDCNCNCCTQCSYTPGCSFTEGPPNCCSHCAHTVCSECAHTPYVAPNCNCDCNCGDDHSGGGC